MGSMTARLQALAEPRMIIAGVQACSKEQSRVRMMALAFLHIAKICHLPKSHLE